MLDAKQKWALARILYEARKRAAWGTKHGSIIIAREPWAPHAQHPLVFEDHFLALAQVEELLKTHVIAPKGIDNDV